MKKYSPIIGISIAIIISLTSCTLKKHIYTSGYHFERDGNEKSIASNNERDKKVKKDKHTLTHIDDAHNLLNEQIFTASGEKSIQVFNESFVKNYSEPIVS